MLPIAIPLNSENPQILHVRSVGPEPHHGELVFGKLTFPCALGKSGISRLKTEGDGVTPVGQFELLNVYSRPDRVRLDPINLPHDSLVQNAGWCDEPGHPCYNRPIMVPFDDSHEKMWREDRLYDVVVVMNYNMYPVVPGAGSAVFFHIARQGYPPTAGCVAIYPEHMQQLLAVIKPGAIMQIDD